MTKTYPIDNHLLFTGESDWNSVIANSQSAAQLNISCDSTDRKGQARGTPVMDKPVENTNVILTVDQKEYPLRAQNRIKKRNNVNSHSVPQLNINCDTVERKDQAMGLPVMDKPVEKSNTFLTVDQKEYPLKPQCRIKKRSNANQSPDAASEMPLRSLSWSGSSVMLSASDSDADISPLSTPHTGYMANRSSGMWCSSTDVSVKSSWSIGEINGWNGIIGGDNAEMSSIGSILNSLPTTPCNHHEVR